MIVIDTDWQVQFSAGQPFGSGLPGLQALAQRRGTGGEKNT